MPKKLANTLLLALLSLSLVACMERIVEDNPDGVDTDNTDNPGSHNHGADVSATVPGVWPPILKGMENVQPYRVTALAAAQEAVLDGMRSTVLRNPIVQSAIGQAYREFEASLSDEKSDSSAEFVFFNYAENKTVIATFFPNSDVVVNTFPATRFQPAEHPEEVLLAISVARETLLSNGYQVAELKGTAMLAFPPSNEVPDTDNTFYSERILYVTFGQGSGEIPDYSVLVNLSTSSVSNLLRIN